MGYDWSTKPKNPKMSILIRQAIDYLKHSDAPTDHRLSWLYIPTAETRYYVLAVLQSAINRDDPKLSKVLDRLLSNKEADFDRILGLLESKFFTTQQQLKIIVSRDSWEAQSL